jgi:hypothetical protein
MVVSELLRSSLGQISYADQERVLSPDRLGLAYNGQGGDDDNRTVQPMNESIRNATQDHARQPRSSVTGHDEVSDLPLLHTQDKAVDGWSG